MITYEITINGEQMRARIAQYTCGQTGVQVYCDEGPYATLSIAVPEVELAHDEVIVPVYNLGWPLIHQLVNQGFWEDTGSRVTLPFDEALVYRLKVAGL